MARLGGVSTESFSSARDRALSAASIGLASILRDQKTIPVCSSRANIFLGFSVQTPSSPASSLSLSNSPVRSLATSPTESGGSLDAGDDPAGNIKEEDMASDCRNPTSLMEHLGLTNGAASHGFDVRNHGYDQAFSRHGSFAAHARSHRPTHTYNQQQRRHSYLMHHDGSKQKAYGSAGDATRPAARHHNNMVENSVGIKDAIAVQTVRLSPLSKGSDSQTRAILCGGRRKPHDAFRHSECRSAPVDVPNRSRMLTQEGRYAVTDRIGETSDEEDESERLPPHEMLAREYAQRQSMTSSVCEGHGRTLKGRDMRRVRNAVWEKSGFAD